ncbi:MAG: carboxymuconolactone decarboxylase family protein [bacterium]|jgi:ribonuclease HI|nr:carboxymuconolactone decarboxylase family protein [bacterium]
MSQREAFEADRAALQERLQRRANRNIKRVLSCDHACYQDGALPARQKELLGLGTSLALRCDDCVRFHLIRCHDLGWTAAELMEALEVALVVGGSITIPHLRRAVSLLDELEAAAGR